MTKPDQGRPITLTTEDGTNIAVTHYPASAPKAKLVIAGATGVPQGFYRRFALFMASRGFDTLTLEYRGVGRSAPKTLRGFKMTYLDWSLQDLPAAIRHHQRPELPVYIVGHSYGGHAIGLLPEDCRVDAFYGYAVGAGWHGWMPFPDNLQIWAMWHIFGPPMVAILGYMPSKALGIGEDLPLGVYKQWKRWCGWPTYFFADPDMHGQLNGFKTRRLKMHFVNARDDHWANSASRNAFVQHYTGADITHTDLDPRPFGKNGIGHLGYFRPHAEPLWHELVQWFDTVAHL